ncbi:hypothetical protein ScPMuIL_007347, partial [Solemya velum]
GVIVDDTASILTEQYNFYYNLYNCPQVNENDIENFTSVLTSDVSESDRELCDKDISDRDIFNISSIRDVIDMVEDNNTGGFIINIDQMKAFD